jgi:uncharacterized protein (DUF302 family)
MEELAFSIQLNCGYEHAMQVVKEALKSEGFGVLTEIDVKSTLKEKLGEDFRKYSILGACNPPLAHKALQAEAYLGLLLPCNVTVEETESGTRVNLVNPNEMLLSVPTFNDNQTLKEVAADATERIERVAAALSSQ